MNFYTSIKDVEKIKVWSEEDIRAMKCEYQRKWRARNPERNKELHARHNKTYRTKHRNPIRKAIHDEFKRLRELGLCTICKIRPRYRNDNRCSPCLAIKKRECRERKKLQERLDLLAKFNFKCLMCGERIEKPVTKNNKVRYVCHPCFVGIKKKFRHRSGKEIHRLLEEAKMKFGVVPMDVLKMVPSAKRSNTLGA